MPRSVLARLFVLIFLLAGHFQTVSANTLATITVTTIDDVISDDVLCSLREAVIAANTDSAFGGCPAGSGTTDTINFSPNLPTPFTITLTTSGANEDASLTGDIDITEDLSIIGSGSAYTLIDGNHSDRIFDIHTGAHVTLSNMTVQNGDPGGMANGGGIQVEGALTMNNSTIRANQGDGISNLGGGLVLSNVRVLDNLGDYGIRNENNGTLTIDDSTISGNQGGGIYNNTSSVTLTNLLVNNNAGSGVYNTGATLSHLTVSSSAILNNSTTLNGGGIFNEGTGAIASISTTTIRNNSASAAGGGVFNNGVMSISSSTLDQNQARTGGGIDHFGGNLSMTNDTLSSNSVLDNGGGLYNRGAALLTNVTLNTNIANGPGTGGNIFNDTASLSLINTIVSNSDVDGNCFNSGGFIISLGYNLDSGNTCGFTSSGDLVNTPPMLGQLQYNGGQSFTHALLASSPAIDAGSNADCPASDQREAVRPVDGDGINGASCDIGAYEYLSTAPVISTIYLPMAWR